MSETTETGEAIAPVNASAGHLSVRVAGAHPPDLMFSFEQRSSRLLPAFGTSFLLQFAAFGFFLILSRFGVSLKSSPAVLPDEPSSRIIWLNEPGPGGGGGGGGNKMPDPPRQAQLPGKDKITVPVSKPVQLEAPQQAKLEPSPVEQLNIPAKELASSTDSLPGVIEAPPGPPTLSQGPGSGGGAGSGTGTGIGPGTGSGLGPGSGGGTGGGVYQPGNGVTLPRILKEVKPAYTSEAMRAKVQGVVLLQCVVRSDGSVSDIQVVRSLDSVFGLDQEATKAARQWRFVPGTRMGQPVAVQITIELTFTLR
jgi:periplasmic protein TonB